MSEKDNYKSLDRKVSLVSFFSIGVILIAVTLMQIPLQKKFIFQQELHRYDALAGYVAKQMSGGVRWGKENAIKNSYEKIVEDPNSYITNIEVYDLLGKSIVSFREGEKAFDFPKKIKINQPQEIKTSLDENHYLVSAPIGAGSKNETVGWVSIAWGLDPIHAKLDDLNRKIYLINLVVGFFLLVLLYFLLKFVSKRMILNPLNRITRTILSVSKGETEIEIPETDRQDEIGQVAMATQVFKDSVVHAMQIKTAFSAAISPIIIVDSLGKVKYFNEAAKGLFLKLNPDESIQEEIFALGKYIDRKIDLSADQIKTYNLDLEGAVYQIRAVPVLNEANESIGLVLECTDKTQEKIIENEIEHIIEKIISGHFDYRINLQNKDGFPYAISKGVNHLIEALVRAHEDVEKRAEDLKRSKERYALALKGLNDGVWEVNLEVESVFFSDRWKETLGYDKELELRSLEDWFALVHPDYLQTVQETLDLHLRGDIPRFEVEYKIKNAQGHYQYVLARGIADRNEAGDPTRIAGSQTDISARKKYEEDLHHAAFHDALTGLPNRALFLDRLQHAANQSRRLDHSLSAVFFIDLDQFKVINDSQGHHVGDLLLKQVAERLKECTRAGDTLARLGGDEFTILAHNLEDHQHAEVLAERIQSALIDKMDVQGHKFTVSASIGISFLNDDPDLVHNVLQEADLAMYHAKKTTTGHVSVFTEEQMKEVTNRHELEKELHVALEKEEFEVYYQPIVNLADGKIVSFEALIRWLHPEKGFVQPDDFISIAEETGQIVGIGSYMLQKVIEQLEKWEKNFGRKKLTSVSVNLSPAQFVSQDSIEALMRIIKRGNVPPNSLTFEVTESLLISDTENVKKTLLSFKALGIDISLDDFGTGYSSLSYLKDFPFDILKIDRLFVSQILKSEKDFNLVKSIIGLAQNQDLKIVAEGIEIEAELNALKSLKCDFGQGYYFSRPVPGPQATHFIASHAQMPMALPKIKNVS